MFPPLAIHKGGNLQCFSARTHSSILTCLWNTPPVGVETNLCTTYNESEESERTSVALLMQVTAVNKLILISTDISGEL